MQLQPMIFPVVAWGLMSIRHYTPALLGRFPNGSPLARKPWTLSVPQFFKLHLDGLPIWLTLQQWGILDTTRLRLAQLTERRDWKSILVSGIAHVLPGTRRLPPLGALCRLQTIFFFFDQEGGLNRSIDS